MTVRWALAGTGALAQELIAEYRLTPGAELVAVASRSLERARAFAADHGIERAYGSYAELAAAPDVDIIHIVTPHPQHLQVALDAVAGGKAVLVEKAFTATPEGAAELVEAADRAGVFCMEAMWTRFLPIVRAVHEVVDSGEIGDLHSVQGDLYALRVFNPEHRLFARELGGGAMLDLGVYVLSFAVDFLGRGAELVGVTGSTYPNGAESDVAMLLSWPGGRSATLMVSLRSDGPGRMVLHGSKGWIELYPRFHYGVAASVHVKGQAPREIEARPIGTGYVHELTAVTQALQAGRTQHDLMPLDDTLDVQRLMSQALKTLGVQHHDDRSRAGEAVQTIARNDATQRYELTIDDTVVGLIDYRAAGDGLVALPHTEVDRAFGGRGLAGELVQYALDDVRARGLKVAAVPLCPYIDAWITKHPDYEDLRA